MNLYPWGSNQYDAMLAKVEHRFSKGFAVINSFNLEQAVRRYVVDRS